MTSRRDILLSALALSASNPLPLLSQPRISDNLFTLGIASGEPSPDGIVLWTRLVGASLPNANIEAKWEIAEDEGFKKIVRKGKSVATPALAHSIHVEASGLKRSRWYWFRFEVAGQRSPAGRFRTAPKTGDTPDRFRFAVASCQQWTQGLWTAYQHLAAEDLDLVVHLGDYIYEQGYRGTIRPEGQAETFTLSDYRNRHALYKTDPLLQRSHQNAAWCVTWDDHEVSNNYANDIQEKGQPREEFMKRRAYAYQAFYEHMPMRRAALPVGPDMNIQRRIDFGSLLRLHMLDTRQYRTDQPCGDGVKPACAEQNNPAQTMLGLAQEKWLAEGLNSSQATWDVLGQGLFVTTQDFDDTPAEHYNMDSWGGYPLARKRLVDTLAARKQRNTVILTGDVHSHWAGQLHTDAFDVKSDCVAAEFIGTSISSGGDGVEISERAQKSLNANPQIRFYNGRRGYLACEVTPKSWRTDYKVVPFVSKPGAPLETRASFSIAPGKLNLEKV